MKLKKLIAPLAAAAVLAVIGLNVKIQTPEEYYAEKPQAVTEDTDWVILTVEYKSVCSSRELPRELEKDGVMIDGEKYVLQRGDSVFDVIERALRSMDMPCDHTLGSNTYIRGVGGLYEFDFGPMSGWYYTVNGDAPKVSCAAYEPVCGDEIVLKYVTDLQEEKVR